MVAQITCLCQAGNLAGPIFQTDGCVHGVREDQTRVPAEAGIPRTRAPTRRPPSQRSARVQGIGREGPGERGTGDGWRGDGERGDDRHGRLEEERASPADSPRTATRTTTTKPTTSMRGARRDHQRFSLQPPVHLTTRSDPNTTDEFLDDKRQRSLPRTHSRIRIQCLVRWKWRRSSHFH